MPQVVRRLVRLKTAVHHTQYSMQVVFVSSQFELRVCQHAHNKKSEALLSEMECACSAIPGRHVL
jgi:hypothetical protein